MLCGTSCCSEQLQQDKDAPSSRILDALQKVGAEGCGNFCNVISFVGGWETCDWAAGLEATRVSTKEAVPPHTLLTTAIVTGAN